MWRLFILLAVAANPGRAQEEALARLYQEAQSAESRSDYAAAATLYEQIIAQRPTLAEAHANLGNLYYVQGRSPEAQAALQRAVALKPGLAAPYILLGILSFNSGEYEAARRHLDKASLLKAENPLLPLYRGYVYYALGRREPAALSLHEVVRGDRHHQDAWYHLSKIHSELSKEYVQQLQRNAPQSRHAALARSHFYESSANWEQARQELQQFLKQQDDDGLWRHVDWLTRKSQGSAEPPPPDEAVLGSTRLLYDPPEGLAILDAFEAEWARLWRIVKRLPLPPERLYQLAESHQALSFLAAMWVLQSDEQSYRAHQLRGQSLEAAGKLDEAIAEYRQAAAKKPELPTIHFAIGNLYWKRGMMEEALPELEQELRINPRDGSAHYELGDILFTLNRHEEAEKHFAEAVKYAPHTPEAYLKLERIAAARGDTQKAIAYLRRAAAIAPGDATPHYRLWLHYRKAGLAAEAEKERRAFENIKSRDAKSGSPGPP